MMTKAVNTAEKRPAYKDVVLSWIDREDFGELDAYKKQHVLHIFLPAVNKILVKFFGNGQNRLPGFRTGRLSHRSVP